MKIKLNLPESFAKKILCLKGWLPTSDIHAEAKNPHAHILLTMRQITPDGFGKKIRNWNGRDNILKWREAWANVQNVHLAKAGYDIHVDHRSYADRGANIESQIKIGVAGYADKKTELISVEKVINLLIFIKGISLAAILILLTWFAVIEFGWC